MGVDAVVIRHSSAGSPKMLTGWVDCSVVNAGDGMHEHPTQALLDLFTMRERLGYLEGCLLYTSDAAYDLLCVDLGDRRIIQKKIEHIVPARHRHGERPPAALSKARIHP